MESQVSLKTWGLIPKCSLGVEFPGKESAEKLSISEFPQLLKETAQSSVVTKCLLVAVVP